MREPTLFCKGVFMMSLYRRRPETINAIKFTRENFDEIITFSEGAATHFEIERTPTGVASCLVANRVGLVYLVEGDYLIRDDDGHFSKMKSCEFEKAYELYQ